MVIPGFSVWLAIGVGAVLGAWSRFALSLWCNRDHFPWGTLIANGLGAYIIGFLTVWLSAQLHYPVWIRYALITGFLGALTTFSTFSIEALSFIQAAQWGMALRHTLAHVGGSLLLVSLGVLTGRMLTS